MDVCSNKGFDGIEAPRDLCSVCRIKARTQKRQEEARLRVEQLKAERAAKAADGSRQGSGKTLPKLPAEPAAEGCRKDCGDRRHCPAGYHSRRAERSPLPMWLCPVSRRRARVIRGRAR